MLTQRYVWLEEVSQAMPWRLWPALGLPSAAQEPWLLACALDAQLQLIALRAREPMLAHIRFAWWRELLGEIELGGDVRPHPLAKPLQEWGQCSPSVLPLLQAMLESRYEAFVAAEEERLDAVDRQNAAAEVRLLELAIVACDDAVDAAYAATFEALAAWIAGAERLRELARTQPVQDAKLAIEIQALEDAQSSVHYWGEAADQLDMLPKLVRRFARMQVVIAADIYAQVIAKKGGIFDAPLRYRSVCLPLRLLFTR